MIKILYLLSGDVLANIHAGVDIASANILVPGIALANNQNSEIPGQS